VDDLKFMVIFFLNTVANVNTECRVLATTLVENKMRLIIANYT